MKLSHTLVYTMICLIAMGQGIQAQTSATTPTLVEETQFDKETALLLLSAELAYSRKQPEVAFKNYSKAAQATKDVNIIKYAIELAIELNKERDILGLTQLWAQVDPKDIKAQLMTAHMLLIQNQRAAKTYLDRLLTLAPTEVDNHFVMLSSQLGTRQNELLIELSKKLTKMYPQNPYIRLATAELYAQQADAKNSEHWNQQALMLKPDLTKALILQARIISFHHNSDESALEYLQQQLKHYPQNNALRLFYTKALIDNSAHQKAIQHLTTLLKDPTVAKEAHSLLGDIYFRIGQWQQARQHFLEAQTSTLYHNRSLFLLGEISENTNNTEEAIQWYLQIEPSEHYLSARLRASELLEEQGKVPEALQTIKTTAANSILEYKIVKQRESLLLHKQDNHEESLLILEELLSYFQKDVPLHYQRALVHQALGHAIPFEKDLQTVLHLDPEHAESLHTLAHHLGKKSHYQEAIELAHQAVSLQPENVIFLDTLGWLHYLAGNFNQSAKWLYAAVAKTEHSIPEIEAHLGEALWALGKKQEARTILKKALAHSPEDQLLLAVCKKLNLTWPK